MNKDSVIQSGYVYRKERYASEWRIARCLLAVVVLRCTQQSSAARKSRYTVWRAPTYSHSEMDCRGHFPGNNGKCDIPVSFILQNALFQFGMAGKPNRARHAK